jgi:hypothetical protein
MQGLRQEREDHRRGDVQDRRAVELEHCAGLGRRRPWCERLPCGPKTVLRKISSEKVHILNADAIVFAYNVEFEIIDQ